MRVGIVGLGLVGGSLALDLLDRDATVVGHDVDADHRAMAADAGVRVVDGARAVATAADLVVVAVPPSVVADVLAELVDVDLPVTDVASVKDPRALGVDRAPARWVGGHPMAGTERTGFAAARRGMLAGATWLLTPDDHAATVDVRAVLELVLAVRARPVVVDAAEHDRLVAAVSHVTHLLSYALHGVAGRHGRQVVDLVAGPSFRDATRVAASDPTFWADVASRNGDAVREVLTEVQAWLAEAMEEDAPALAERLARARRHPMATSPDEVVLPLDGSADALSRLRDHGRAGYAVTAVEGPPDRARLRMHRR